MNLGTLLSSAGQVSAGMRKAEEAERVARENQLRVEELNRLEKYRRLQRGQQVPQEVAAITEGRDLGIGVRAGLAPAQVAPAAPAAIAAPVAPVAKQPWETAVDEWRAGLPKSRGVDEPPPGMGTAQARPGTGAAGTGNMFTPQEQEIIRLRDLQRRQGASQYDKATEYDNLIHQSAIANGLDPVVFKRLIGSESSFNPDAESPRGAKYGLGIAQIAATHGLSREEMLDPVTALPKAAQIFKQYLDEAGGDYRQALLRYKGATSERGIQEMNAVIDREILTDLTPTTAAAPAVASAAANARAARGADALGSLAAPGAIDYGRRLALQQRQELVNLASMQQQAGLGNEFSQTRQLIMQLDSQLAYLQGMQGLSNLQLAKDPRLLAGVLSFYTGNDVAIQRFNDGTYDMFFNGEKIEENLDAATLADIARLQFDPEYRQRQAEATAKYNEERYKTAMELRTELLKIRANMGRELAVQNLKNQGDIFVEQFKRDNPKLEITNLGDGRVIISHPDGGVYTFDLAGDVEEIDGVEVTTRTAQRVGGLPRLAARN